MSRGVRLILVLAACTGLVCLLSASFAEVTPKRPAKADGLVMVFPPNHSVLLSGELDLICKTEKGELEVEGELLQWEPFEPPLRVSHLSLYPGRNRIHIGSRNLEVFVARDDDNPGGPKGWKLCRSHPIEGVGAKRCAACHETRQRDQRTVLGDLKSYEACFRCHRATDFEVAHAHPLEPIEHCQMCHSLHGSNHKTLLKAPLKQLCADCHDS